MSTQIIIDLCSSLFAASTADREFSIKSLTLNQAAAVYKELQHTINHAAKYDTAANVAKLVIISDLVLKQYLKLGKLKAAVLSDMIEKERLSQPHAVRVGCAAPKEKPMKKVELAEWDSKFG